MEASHFIQTTGAHQALEEIAFRQGGLEADRVTREGEKLGKTGYGLCLQRVLKEMPVTSIPIRLPNRNLAARMRTACSNLHPLHLETNKAR